MLLAAMVTSIAKLVGLVVILALSARGGRSAPVAQERQVAFTRVGLSLTEELAEVDSSSSTPAASGAQSGGVLLGRHGQQARPGGELGDTAAEHQHPRHLRLSRDLWDIGVALDELRVVVVWDDDADHRVKERPFHASPDEIEEATHRCALMPWPHDPSG